MHRVRRTCCFNVLKITTLNVKINVRFYRISYIDDLQTYTYRKHFSDIGFKASKIHLKIGRFFFGSVYKLMYKVVFENSLPGQNKKKKNDVHVKPVSTVGACI